jgi:hypothetical protein
MELATWRAVFHAGLTRSGCRGYSSKAIAGSATHALKATSPSNLPPTIDSLLYQFNPQEYGRRLRHVRSFAVYCPILER